jgi:hypothetical protein
MRRAVQLAALILLALILLGAAVARLKPALAPTYLYYDLVGRWAAPLPPDVERFMIQSGDDYCAQGHDTACGGYRVVGGRALAVGPAAQASGVAAAWCVDYVVLRANLGRSRALIPWANIPGAMVVTRTSDGRYESSPVEDCATASL